MITYSISIFTSGGIALYYLIGAFHFWHSYGFESAMPLFGRAAVSISVSVGCIVALRSQKSEARERIRSLPEMPASVRRAFLEDEATQIPKRTKEPREVWYEFRGIQFAVTQNGEGVSIRSLNE